MRCGIARCAQGWCPACRREESDSNSILRLINSTTKSLRDFCIKRQGTGSSECPIGLAYYNNFFLLHPVVFAYPGATPLASPHDFRCLCIEARWWRGR